jgi:hypothetical protein
MTAGVCKILIIKEIFVKFFVTLLITIFRNVQYFSSLFCDGPIACGPFESVWLKGKDNAGMGQINKCYIYSVDKFSPIHQYGMDLILLEGIISRKFELND